MDFVSTPPPRLYRVSYGPQVIRLRDWSAANVEDRLGNRTFGHRWDDPRREFRSLYLADSALGAVIEALQDMLPHPAVIARARQLVVDTGDEKLAVGVIDPQFFDAHYLGALSVEPRGNFVDVLHRDVISAMNSEHGLLLQRLNLGASCDRFGSARNLRPADGRHRLYPSRRSRRSAADTASLAAGDDAGRKLLGR